MAAIALVSMVVLLAVAMLAVPFWIDASAPLGTTTFRAASLMLGVTCGAFWLNRHGHSRGAALVFGVAAIVTLTYAATEEPALLVFLTLTMLTGSALLPIRQAFAIGLAAILAPVAVVLLAPHGHGDIVLPLLLNASFLPLMLVVKWHTDRLARLRAAELSRRQHLFATTLSSIGDAVLTTDVDERVTFMNPIAEALTGYTAAEAIGRKVDEVFTVVAEHSGAAIDNPVHKALELRQVVDLANHAVLVARDGTRRPIADSGAPIISEDGLHGVVLVFRDVSDERALRAQLEHSQRLDALGKLAGGVAHDFNNLLTAIGGGAQLAFDDLPSNHPSRNELAGVLDATNRAVGVTRQLLAFSRRQVMRLEPVELNAAVQGAVRLFQRLLKPGVDVESHLSGDAGFILIDPVQFEQVLLNLAVNANDAMHEGGTLSISTARVRSSELQVEPPLPPGEYGRLRVRDTGIGMDESTLARMFEPFFTTKARGRGTGLGLATVYGIVEQSQGAIRVSSIPGNGTTFDVYLPTTEAVLHSTPPQGKVIGARTGRAPRVLLVEDDELVRNMALRVLTAAHYVVSEAGSAQAALSELAANADGFDLLITDVVMPGLSGVELAQRVRDQQPSVSVLFMSGYATEVLAQQGLRGDASGFLPKPFTPESLRDAVRAALDRPSEVQSTG